MDTKNNRNGTIKVTKTILILSLLIVLSLNVFAQNEQFSAFIDVGASVMEIFNAGKIVDFLLTFALIIGTLYFTLNKIREKRSESGEQGKKKIDTTGWLLIFAVIFGISPIAGWVLKDPSAPTFAWGIAWTSFILFSTFLSTQKRNGEEHDYGGYAFFYFLVSGIISPFASLAKGSAPLTIGFVHGFIAIFVIYLWPKSREEKRIKQKALEEEKKSLKEKEYQEVKEEKEFKRRMEIAKVENNASESDFAEKEPIAKKLAEVSTSVPPTQTIAHPFLVSIAQAIPVQDKSKLPLFQKIDMDAEIDKINKNVSERKGILKQFKENYASTKAGKEAAYLLGVMKELQDDIAKKKLEHWVDYVGKDWNRCDFAEKLSEFKNRGYEHLQKLMKESIKGGPEKIIRIMKNRISEVQRERKNVIDVYSKTIENANKVSPAIAEAYRKKGEETDSLNKEIIEYNSMIDQINSLLHNLRSDLHTANSITDDNQRRSLITTRIFPAFTKTAELLRKLKQTEEKLLTDLKRKEDTEREKIKTEETLFEILGLSAVLKKQYGIVPEGELT